VSLGKGATLRDGLGEFSEQLCRRFARDAVELRERFGLQLFFHLHPALFGRYGDEVQYLPAHRLQRYFATPGPACALWHRLDHFNGLRPTRGTDVRSVTIHDLNFVYAKSGMSYRRGDRRVRHALAKNDHIVTISRYVRDDIAKRYDVSRPIEVIHNGARSLVDSCGRTAVAAVEGRRFLFHLSRMSPSKNAAAIVELARVWPEMEFVMAGPERSDSIKLREAVANAPLANLRIMLNITDEQKAWLYEHCAGFLFPSLTEGFGLPPIEAMHFGRPVFVSDRTCLPEIGGAAAHYLTRFDPASMRAVIEPAIEPATAAARAELVRGHAAQFDWDRAARAYLTLFGQWLGVDLSAVGQHSETTS
jgi:glycosyltransferase involved in cell wall biosynthesis